MALVDYTVRAKVAIITLNRPDKLNAINEQMRVELLRTIEDVRVNPEAWIGVVRANGAAFSVGHDLTEPFAGDSRAPSIRDLYCALIELTKPLVAVIDGYCLAQGAGLALACDLRIASDRATFGWPQVKRGLSSISGPAMLAQLIPLNLAMEALFLGEMISSTRALELNLVNWVVPQSRVDAVLEDTIAKLLDGAPLAMRAIKEAAIRGRQLTIRDRLCLADAMLETVARTADAREGLAAFADKRQPIWRGE